MRRLLNHRILSPSLLLVLAAAASVACGDGGNGGPADVQDDGAAGSTSASAGSRNGSGNGSGDGKGGEGSGEGGSASDGSGGTGAVREPALNEGEFTVAAFEYTDPKPAGYNPLGKDRFNLLRLEETAFVLNGGDGGYLLDDAQHGLARSSLKTTLTPAGTQAVWSGSGNLDDDGHAELVVVSHGASDVTVVVGDNDGDAPLAKTRTFSVPHGGAVAGAIKAALGDFDGDGRQELALAVSAGQGGWVRIYDDAAGDFALLKEVTRSDAGHGDFDLTAGNFDDDSASELAVLRVGSGSDEVTVRLFDDAAKDFALKKTIGSERLLPAPGQGNEYSEWLSGGIVRSGNVDADAKDELYVLLTHRDIGSKGTGINVVSSLLFDAAGEATLLGSPGSLNDVQYPQRSVERPFDAVFADMDGDGVDELYQLHLGADENTFAWYLSQWVPGDNAYDWNRIANYHKLDTNYNPVALGRLAVISGDELAGETLVVAVKNTGSEHPLRTTRILAEASVQADDVHQSFALDIPELQSSAIDYPSSSVPLVAGGDFDNDNLQVRYTGNKWLSLASPRPIAVLAAPPQNAGISQSEADSGTAFGEEALRGTATTDELGASYGSTLSFDSSVLTSLFGSLGGLASGSVSSSIERAFSYSETESTIESYGTSYTGAYPDNCIVFQGVLHTSYEYEITTASDPAAVGHKLTIDVPVAVKTYKWTLDFYNERLGKDGVRIGAETLSHVVGDPSSYPTAKDRDALLKNGGWKSKQVSVGQGSGYNRASISLSKEKTTASTNTITNDDSWGTAVAGFGYEESQAITGTTVYEVTVGSSTNYEGVVGDIKNYDDYREYSYDFGLMVYPFKHPQGPAFQVVSYWTSNLGPGFK